MKKEKIFAASMLLIATVAFSSCKKEPVDNEKPVIQLVAPEEDEVIHPGSEVHFEVDLSDNVALESYKVNIHGAFDGHHHDHAAAALRAEGDSIIFEKTWLESDFIRAGETAIDGKKSVHIHHHLIKIPETINGKPLKEGHYHFMVYCTDRARQEAFVAREIVISSKGGSDHEHH